MKVLTSRTPKTCKAPVRSPPSTILSVWQAGCSYCHQLPTTFKYYKTVLLRYIENIKISIRYRYIVSYHWRKYQNFWYIGIKFIYIYIYISSCPIFVNSLTHSRLGLIVTHRQWCRSVVKYGGQGQSGQAIKLFQKPQKISFTFHFWHIFLSLMMWNCLVIQQVLNERMWHFRGLKHTLTPPTYFQAVKTQTPGSTPLLTEYRHPKVK